MADVVSALSAASGHSTGRETRADDALEASAIPNLRDAGGHAIQHGGQMRTGVLFRSAALAGLGDDAMAALAQSGVATICDLRTAQERSNAPDRVPDGVRVLPLDVLADRPDDAEDQAPPPTTILEGLERLLGGKTAEQMMIEVYESFIVLESARAAYGRLFAEVARSETPVLFHCTSGKDRTGWAAASVQMLMGVAPEDVERDYLASNQSAGHEFDGLIAAIRAEGNDPGVISAFLEVRSEYLAAAKATMLDRYGSVAEYFREGLRLDRAQLAALQERLTTR